MLNLPLSSQIRVVHFRNYTRESKISRKVVIIREQVTIFEINRRGHKFVKAFALSIETEHKFVEGFALSREIFRG